MPGEGFPLTSVATMCYATRDTMCFATRDTMRYATRDTMRYATTDVGGGGGSL